jgi:alcohol dehydrogenase class IV
MMDFSFATAGRILFGPGVVRKTAGQAKALGHRALLVTGQNRGRSERLEQDLKMAGVAVTCFRVAGEPDVALVENGSVLAREQGCDLVVGFGGGSVMDAAKAIAALAANARPILDYLEVIGRAQPLENRPLPCIAIPTTAGTGSEVTRNAVIRSPGQRVKVSLRSPDMLPRVALVDPELTLDLPTEVTAATGCDALCQLLEAFVSTKANPLTDGLCREGLSRCSLALKTAYFQGRNLEARTDMALASLFSGLALANAGLGAVHGIAAPLGGMTAAPHGAVCARLLPFVTAANIEALETRPEAGRYLRRYREAAALLTGNPGADARDLVCWLDEISASLRIASLSRWGLQPGEVSDLAARALKSSSMQGNPVPLDSKTLEGIIEQAMAKDA